MKKLGAVVSALITCGLLGFVLGWRVALIVVAVSTAVVLGVANFHRITDPIPPGTSDADIARLVRGGERTRALRWYRTIHGAGLKDAREAIDRMAQGTPDA